MCGIIGSVNYHLSDQTVQLIRHRGPDGFGAKKLMIGSNSIELYHHRLSILDLSSNGSQPMVSSDGLGVMTFNGEIYNHLELKDTIKDIDFRGHSDTETLVNLCRTGCIENTLSLLNGIFSFAYLDIELGKLFLVRDRFGVKPLYYFIEDNQLVFSSELRSILAVVGQEFIIGSIATAIEIRHLPAPATMFKNIFKVEPGQVVTISLEDTLSVSKSYFADLPERKGKTNRTKKQLVGEYGQLLEKAVERQLLSDVEVGILLSGGVDSALVAAIAKTKVNKVKAFTVGFEDKELDERAYARATADYLNLEHFTAEVKFGDFIREFEQVVNIVEEPVDSGSLFSMYTLSELASSKVKVVLSGQGADEPLGGYRKYKALPTIDFLHNSNLSQNISRFCLKYIKQKSLRRVLSCVGTASNIHAYFEFNSLFGDNKLHQIMNQKDSAPVYSIYSTAINAYHDVLQRKKYLPQERSSLFTYLDTRTKLPETLLNYTDKITMHFALECRVPMLDNDLVEFIESIPRKYKFSFNRSKIVHKEFAREYLPESIINRKKLAFHGPSKAHIRNNAEEIRAWIIHNKNQFFWNLFDKDKVVQLVDEHAQLGNREKELILIISTLFLTSPMRD
jgi:asparagine synthase (glutamine-hydrolysing)